MSTNVKKPMLLANTTDEQFKDRFRRQLIIDRITDANCQQGSNRGNFKNNTRFSDKTKEPNIPRTQIEQREKKNLGLQNIEQKANTQTLQDD
ncbi:MAG: hypothetical protein EZS28_027615 [Streblomastix strix]|uniref:Uncharacterized protein n=1 Tax=Streblomastix strix TaxID=222440 RepID=A0A5J4V292_9EUKA|nr:MAG: hypothetical protein EZS28_027615 [Streblomastix strix]